MGPAANGTATINSKATAMGTAIDWALLRRDPYRVLFPLGTVSAMIGIGIWIPYAIWPGAMPYPGQGHAVIQIQAFLMCFVFGFLTTMLPKLLGVRPLGPIGFALFPLLLIGITLASLAGAALAAQAMHLAVLVNFLVFAASRLPERRVNPPPPFVFIAAAMAVDILGTVLKLGALSGLWDGNSARAGAILQYQAFPMFLIVGVGGFLLPKLFASGPIDPKTLASDAPRFRGQILLCLALLAGFAIEIAGLYAGWGRTGTQVAYAMRAAVWAVFLARDIRIMRRPGKLPLYLHAARISLVVMLLGLIMPVFRPQYLLAWEHVIFLSGFLRLTLSVASRVLAAHAGRLEILTLHGRTVRIYGLLIVLAMMTRLLTEFFPAGRVWHLAIASGLALVALWLWGRLFLPLVRLVPGR